MGKGVEYDDLFQISSVGLLKAINNFSLEYNVKFSTYAVPMVLGEVKRFLRDDGYVKVSRSVKTQANKINQWVEAYRKTHQNEPSVEDAIAILTQYKGIYSPADDGDTWFNKVRELGETLGFAAKPKDYKKNPDQFKGHVGDVSQVIRLAITGRTNSPDLCSVMQILGEATCQQRLDEAIATLSK